MISLRYPHSHMEYQPVVDFYSGGVLFFEALFRPGNEESPQDVCRLAEQQGWIIDIDLFALRSSQATLQKHETLCIAVNVSGASIMYHAQKILDQLDQVSQICTRLTIEITETHNIEIALLELFVHQCRLRHIKIAQDDFGVDFSTASRARIIRPDVIKIVAPIARERLVGWANDYLLNAAELARELKAILLVERIETVLAEDIARLHGATAGQGYAYGKPEKLVNAALSIAT
ncbi:EAL domain-containing protein [Herbaspirillum huttiense]|uniref:EAL domain-containing protein n=1 Tax=Herbaspirillum huttiense TaxID=863372 RepID=UPI0039AEB8B0